MDALVIKDARITGRQWQFLRDMRKHPHGLPLDRWPRPTTWRRWLRRPRFQAAMHAILDSQQLEARLLMSGAATQAAYLLQMVLTGGSPDLSGVAVCSGDVEMSRRTIKSLVSVLWTEKARRGQLQHELAKRAMDQLAARAQAADESAARAADASDNAKSAPDRDKSAPGGTV